jgi:hypothetical protein
LADPLAEILERILSHDEGRVVSIEPSFDHCPRCAHKLEPFDDGDIYVQALRCGNHHTWGERGRHLGTTEQPAIELNSEMSDPTLRQSARFWVENTDETVRSIVPLTVHGILQQFLSR